MHAALETFTSPRSLAGEADVPTALRLFGYRFFFSSLDRGEPPHVHVERSGAHAKVWLDPVATVWSAGFPGRELSTILRIVHNHRRSLLEAWHEHFSR